MKIGKTLKTLRKEKNITLKKLSAESGVATATLSRIEHNIMEGTLKSHAAICRALKTSLSDFYREVESADKTLLLLKEKNRPTIEILSKKVIREMLVEKMGPKKMIPFLLKIEPGCKTAEEQDSVGSEKFIYVLDGNITAVIDKTEWNISKGDSLYFQSSLGHAFRNKSNRQTQLITITTP